MSDRQFIIKSIKGHNKLVFSNPLADGFSWDAEITIMGFGLHVSRRTELHSLETLLFHEFFEDLAKSWNGWKENKRFVTLDNKFSIDCSTDSTGHIFMLASLTSEVGGLFDDWTVRTFIEIEAGQLENIASRAKAFFESI